jgi:predicted nucleotidyltransferase
MRLSGRMLDGLESVVRKNFGDSAVYLFGSRACDEKRGGDIDVAIKTDLAKEEFKKKRLALQVMLAKIDFDVSVDVVQYAEKMDEVLKREIDTGGIEIMHRRENWVQSLSRELFWDVHQNTVTSTENLKWLIERVLIYGRARDWSLLISNIPKARIAELSPHLRIPQRERIFLDNYLETQRVTH